MTNQNKSLLFVVVVAANLVPQGVPIPSKQATAAQPLVERDKQREDHVAKLFETIRADAKITPLSRIRHRDSLEQTVCTIAVTGTLPKYASTNTFAYYKTADPESISTELNKVASFNRLHPKNNLGYSRYSAAVWRAKDSQTGDTTYWVGVELYWPAVIEFFDYHFTDDIFYHNLWKKSVAPQCRGK